MCRNEYDLVFYRVLYFTLFAIGLTFTVILTSVFVDIDGILTLRNKDAHHTEPPQIKEFYKNDQSESDSRSDNESNNENFDDTPPDYDDTSESQPSRIKRSTDGQKYRFKNPQVTKILTSHLASLLEQFDDADTSVYRRTDTIVTTTEIAKLKDRSQYDRLKDELVKQTKEMEEENAIDNNREILKNNLKNLFLDAVAANKHSFDDVARKIKTNLEAYESLTDSYLIKPTASVLLDPGRSRDSGKKNIEQVSICDSLIDQMMQCLRGRGTKQRSFNAKEPKLLIKTTIDISSLAGKPVDNLTYGKDEVMGVVKLVLNGKEILVESQLDDVLELMRKHGFNVDSDNNIISLGQNIPIEIKKDEMDFERNNVDETRRSLEDLMRAYLRLSSSKSEQSYVPIYSVNNQRKRRHKRHVENVKEDASGINFFNEDEDEESKAIKKRKVLKALVNKIETLLHTDAEEKQKANKKKAMILKHWHIKKRMQNPLKSENNRGTFNKTRQYLQDYAVVTSSPLPACSVVENNEKNDIKQNVKKKQFMESAETGEVDIDYDNIMFFKDIPQRQQRPLNADSVELSSNIKSNMYPLKNTDGSPSGYTVNFNKNNGKDATKLVSGIEDLMMSYSNIYKDLDALSSLGGEYGFGHGVSKRDLKKVVQDESSDEENHVHKSKYNILNGRVFLPFENYQDIYNSESKRFHRKNKISHHHSGRVNYLDQLGNYGDLPEEDLLMRKLKPADILSLANILETPSTTYRKKRSVQPPLTIKYPVRKRIKSRVIHIPISNRQPKSKTISPNKKRKNPTADGKENGKKPGNHYWTDNFKIIRRRNNTKKIKLSYQPPKIRLKRDVTEYEDDSDANKSQGGKSYEKIVNYKNDEEGDPGSMSSNNEESHSAQPAFINSIIYSIKSRRNTLMSQFPQIFAPNFLKVEDKDDYVEDSQQQSQPEPVRKQELGLNQFLNIDFPTLSNLAQAVATPVEKPNKKNYKVTVKFSPKTAGNNKTNPGFNELHTTINKSYTENGMRYYTVFNVSEISKVEMEKPPGAKIIQKTELLDRIRGHQAKVDAFMRKHQAVMDSHLKVFEDDANHLNKALQNIVSNINIDAFKGAPAREIKPVDLNITNPISKVIEPELSGHNTSIKLLNDESATTDKHVPPDLTKQINDTVKKIDMLRSSNVLRGSDNYRGYETFRGSDSLRGSDGLRLSDGLRGSDSLRGTAALRHSERHFYHPTDSPFELKRIPETNPITTPPNVMQEIVHKNVFLTEEILKKIDRNTEILNTFLNRLMTQKETVPETTFTKKFPLFKTYNNTQLPKTYYRKMNDQTYQADSPDYQPNKLEVPNDSINDKKINAVFDLTPNDKHNSNENNFHVPKLAPKQMVFGMNTIDKHMSNEHIGHSRVDSKIKNDEAYFLDSPFTNAEGKKMQHGAIDSPTNDRNMMLGGLDHKKPKAVNTPKVITLPFKVKINSTENSIP